MKILSFIEDRKIKKILKHLDLWDLKSKPLPRANAPPNNIEPHLDYSHRGVGPYGPASGSYEPTARREADSQLPSPARQCQALAGGSLSLRRVSEFRNSEAGGSYDYLYVDEQYLEGPSA